MVVIWLPLANKALEDIFSFYSENNLQAARRIISDLLQAAEQLAFFPEMAAVEPVLSERPEVFRSLVVRHNYKIVYYMENEIVYIADIWDCRQDPKILFRRI